MNHPSNRHLSAQSDIRIDSVPKRLRALAETGATGGQLSPREVKEICEALCAQSFMHPTRFHGGFGC